MIVTSVTKDLVFWNYVLIFLNKSGCILKHPKLFFSFGAVNIGTSKQFWTSANRRYKDHKYPLFVRLVLKSLLNCHNKLLT